jgi:17beta-estradiol 17-dehydrogenase / very-long-chain 3-oxoacyl-CoA reductase
MNIILCSIYCIIQFVYTHTIIIYTCWPWIAGIGYALVKEIARRGMNVIIVSRRENELKQVKYDIEGLYSDIKIEYIATDCSDVISSVDKIVEFVKGKNVSMLVNNVGVESGDPEPYAEKSVENMERIINVNIRFSSIITLKILPLIINNCKSNKLKGAVINLSSNASILDTPLLVGYTSSKGKYFICVVFNTFFDL